MPDGSLYTGSIGQDEILKSRNPNRDEDTPLGVVAGKLLTGTAGMVNQIGSGYAGLFGLRNGPDAASQNVQDVQSKAPTQYQTAPNASPAAAYAGKMVDAASALPTQLGLTASRDILGNETPELTQAVGQALGEVGPIALGLARGAPRGVPETAVEPPMGPEGSISSKPQEVVNRAYAGQSMGAAAAAPDISKASAQLQQAIAETAQKSGGAVNPTALANHIEADKFGVQLTDGQASRDPVQYSNEQNSTDPRIVSRLNKQNGQLVDALDEVRRDASPTTVSNDPIQNGQIVVDALKAYDEPIKADIKAKYQKLIDANGGTVPIDANSFLTNTTQALKKNYLTDSVPPAANELLTSLKNGEPLDFEGFEAARTRLAEAQRNGGSEGAAAKIIRGQLEQMPLSAAASNLKGLADTARSAAKSRFDALDADPAYEAAVDDTVPKGKPSPLADRFLDKYALGNAPKSQVDLMMGKLDEDAQGAVASHTLSAIRKGAVGSTGNITPAGFNSALTKYAPKLDSLIDPSTRDDLTSLSNVVTNAKSAPPGNFVNYSKSGVIRNAATGTIQELGGAALNAKTFGMGVPIIKGIAERNFARSALAPGAGLGRLSDLLQPSSNP